MTFEDLRLRHSVRTFTTDPLTDTQIRSLEAVITDVNTHEAGMHFQLMTNSDDPFKGFNRGYGVFKNARNYVACVVDTSFANYMERGGYWGMHILMRAFTLGLGTCFVSGTYSAKNVEARVRPGEKLLYVIVIGKETTAKSTFTASLITKIAHRKPGLTPMDFLDTDLPWEKICAAFPGLLKGLEGVSYAPSAMNKQPVGILIKKADNPYTPVEEDKKSKKQEQRERERELSRKYDALLQSNDTADSDSTSNNGYVLQAYVPAKKPAQLIDLGIAMYNFQVGYPGTWEWGNPATFLPDK